MKRILITGSNGFVGHHLIHKLHEKGKYVVIETGSTQSIDLCNSTEVEALPICDIIVHLAALSYVPDSFSNPGKFYRNNIVSTINMLEKAKKDCAKFIFLSTYVYGNPEYLPIDELHRTNPLNPYTQSKLVGEELCKAYNRDFKIPIIIFRPFNIYGKNQKDSFFIPTIFTQLDKEAIHLKDPRPKRDFVYVDDLVNAIVSGIDSDFNGIEIYNIGSGLSVSVKETVELIKQVTASHANIIFTNEIRQGEVLDTVADISKAKRLLDWAPKVSLLEGLKKMV